MAKTIIGLFETLPQAEQVVDALVDAGVDRSHISVVSKKLHGHEAIGAETQDDSPLESAGAGAVGGSLLGGGLGLLAGISALMIPGIGPAVAAGPIATALSSTVIGAGIGAAAGGLLGSLVNAGVPETEAHVYAEGVRRGGTLVAAHVNDELAPTILQTMRNAGAADVQTQAANWREQGWTDFDESAEHHPIESALAGATTGVAIGGAQGGPIGTIVGGVVGAVQGLSGTNDPDELNYGTPEDFSGENGAETHAGSTEWEDGSTTPQSGATDEPAAANIEWEQGRTSGKEAKPTTTPAGTVEWQDGSESPKGSPKP